MIKPRARLKDIAEATGFSANTVSLALRASPRLSEETRERIVREAVKLDYSPNHIARSLARNRTRTIGLVLTDIMNPTLTLAARTIERELALAGYAMMFAASDSSIESERRAVDLFRSYQVDGMLIYPASHLEYGHIKAVERAGTPVLLLIDLPGSHLDTVTVDDKAGAYKAFSYLCQRGHKRIAMIDGGRSLGNFDKMNGALRAVRAAGLPDDAIAVFEPEGHSAVHSYAAMDRVMGDKVRPSAVFASTDSLAIGVLQWCREHKIAVPGELAVVGYDNTEISQFGFKPLTTVNYAADEISRIGVARMLERIESRDVNVAPMTRLVEPELIIRESA